MFITSFQSKGKDVSHISTTHALPAHNILFSVNLSAIFRSLFNIRFLYYIIPHIPFKKLDQISRRITNKNTICIPDIRSHDNFNSHFL